MAAPKGFPLSLPITDDDDVDDVKPESQGIEEVDAAAEQGAGPSADLGDRGSATVPLHIIRKDRDSPERGRPRDRHDPPTRNDSIEDNIVGQPPFGDNEVDFEILPDDDDAGDEGVASEQVQQDTTKPRLIRRSSAPSPKTVPIVSPPRSPTNTPPDSPPPSPATPSRNLLSRIAAPLTPRGRVSWKQGQEEEDVKAKAEEEQDGKGAKAHRRSQTTTTDGFALRSPGPFRAMLRARGMTPFKGNGSIKDLSIEPSMGTDDWGQEDGSSSEEEYSEDEDEISIDDESSIFDDVADDAELVSDFSSIPPMPNSFLDLPPDLYDYLDPELVKNIASQKIATIAYEHHLLVKGVLQLLAERDVVGVEGDIHDTSNVVKMGPLKKKSTHGLWSVKYVEIRRGNLSYFSDDASQFGSAPRKTIHLRKRTCRCEPVVETNANADSFVFQLLVEGGPKKLWMAKSDEERQGWIRAINQSMIGQTEGSQDAPVDLSMYQSAIAAYRSVQGSLKEVESREDYLVAVDGLLYRKSSSSALRVPMTWVREEVIQRDDSPKDAHTANALVKTSISENWKCLSSTSVDINGCLISADTAYSAERVIGTLSRCILEFDRVDDCELESGISTKKIKHSNKDSSMTEVEAVSYARTILFGALRSQIRGDVLAAVQNLVQNESIAHVELDKSEPLQIDVSFAGDDFAEREKHPYDVSGWLLTRPKKGKAAWKHRFFVVSEGILSFFAKAEPRPYDLRGQLVLSKCTIESLDDNVLQIEGEEDGRCLQFEDRGVLLKWRTVLERAADPEFPVVISDPPSAEHRRRGMRGTIIVQPVKTATRGAMKAMKGAKNAGMKQIKNARGMIARGIAGRQRGERRASAHDMLIMSTRGLTEAVGTQKREPTVQAVTEFNHVFKVMPILSSDNPEPLL